MLVPFSSSLLTRGLYLSPRAPGTSICEGQSGVRGVTAAEGEAPRVLWGRGYLQDALRGCSGWSPGPCRLRAAPLAALSQTWGTERLIQSRSRPAWHTPNHAGTAVPQQFPHPFPAGRPSHKGLFPTLGADAVDIGGAAQLLRHLRETLNCRGQGGGG